MQLLPKDKAVADDHDDIESSQDDTWSRQNHGAQAIKPRKRGISNPAAPPSKVRQRKTHMEKCADYEFQTASIIMAAQRVVDLGTVENPGPSAREKELEARAAALQKTAMAKMEGFLKLNSDWMSLSSNFTGLSMSDSGAQCSNDPKDLITQVGSFSAAIGDRSSTIQHLKQKGDEIKLEKERTRVLGYELNECKEKWVATRKIEQRLRSERNTLRSQVNTHASESKQITSASTQTSDAWNCKMVTLEQDLSALAVELETSRQINANAEKAAKDRTERDRKTVSELRKELAAAVLVSKKAKGLQEAYDRACITIKMHATERKRLEELSTQQQRQNDLLQTQNLLRQNQIESLEKDDNRSASHIHKLESDLRQIRLDLVSANSEIGVLRGSLTSETTEHSETMHRLRELEHLHRQQEQDLDSLSELGPLRQKAKRLQDDLRYNISNLQLVQAELNRSRVSADASAEKIKGLRSEIRGLKSTKDDMQMDQDSILSDKIGLEKEKDGLLVAKAILEKERDSLISKKTSLQGERDGLISERTTLQKERDVLISKKTSLQVERDDLISEKTTLQKERDGLITERTALQEERDSLLSERTTLQEERDGLLSGRTTLQEERATLVLERSRLEKERESLRSERNLLQREKDDLLSERSKMQREENHLRYERDQFSREIDNLRSENGILQEARDNLESEKERLEKERLDQSIQSQRRRADLLAERAKLTSQIDSTTIENQHLLASISTLKEQVESEKAALMKLPRCYRFFYQKVWWLMFDFGEQGGLECLRLRDDLPKEVGVRLMGAMEEKLPPEDVLVCLEG